MDSSSFVISRFLPERDVVASQGDIVIIALVPNVMSCVVSSLAFPPFRFPLFEEVFHVTCDLAIWQLLARRSIGVGSDKYILVGPHVAHCINSSP